jgi:hypothetical protein
MNKTLKKIIIVLVVLVVIGIGASFFTSDSSFQNPLQSTLTGDTAAPLTQNATTNQGLVNTEEINREFVSTLLNLQAINLNDDIFSEPAFTVLVDNTVRLNQPGNEGRLNPFAPIGTDQTTINLEASASSASQEEVSTAQVVAEEDTAGVETQEVLVSDEEAGDALFGD